MAEDRVVITADASQYFDVLNRAGAAADRFGARGAGIGDGFLRSERIVARSAANMTTGLLSVSTAAEGVAAAGQAVSVSLLGLERLGTIGLVSAVGIAVAATAYEKLAAQAERTRKVQEDVRAAFGKPITLIAHLDVAGITKEIDSLTGLLTSKIKEEFSFAQSLNDIFDDILKHPLPASVGARVARVTDPQLEEDVALSNRITQLSALRGQAELKVAEAKKVSVHQSALEGELLRINSQYESKIAAERLNFNAGSADTIRALQAEQALEREAATKKDFLAQSELITATKIANLRGSEESITQSILAANLQSALSAESRAKASGTILEKEQATLGVAKALQAIYEHNLELQKERISVESSGNINAIQVGAARSEVGASPESAQRIQLEAEVKAAEERTRAAKEFQDVEGASAANEKELETAIAEQSIAKAKLAKFTFDAAFADAQALKAAQGETDILNLQLRGEKDLAAVEKIRLDTLLKVAAAIKAGQLGVAQQLAAQGAAQIQNQFGQQLNRTGPEVAAEQGAQRAAAHVQQVGEAFAKMLEQDVAAGAKLDTAQEQQLKAYEDAKNAVKDSADEQKKAKSGLEDLSGKDFTGISSLSGLDFSSLAAVGAMDFSGLQSLNGLSISIQ